MSCRDGMSERRFGKQKSLVKVTCSGEEGKQKNEWNAQWKEKYMRKGDAEAAEHGDSDADMF